MLAVQYNICANKAWIVGVKTKYGNGQGSLNFNDCLDFLCFYLKKDIVFILVCVVSKCPSFDFNYL